MQRILYLVLPLWAVAFGQSVWGQNQVPPGPRAQLDFNHEPEYELQHTFDIYEEGLLSLWTKALEPGDREVTCKVADNLIMGRKIGHPEMDERVGPLLLKAFQATQDKISRRALARAMVDFNYTAASEELSAACTDEDFEFCSLVEPALAYWGNAAAIERSLERLHRPNNVYPWRRLAIEVLGQAPESKSRDALLPIVLDVRERADLRLAAAKGLGRQCSTGLLADARDLQQREASADPLAALLAVELINNHNGPEVVEVLVSALQSTDTTIHHHALKHLLQIDSKQVSALTGGSPFTVQHPHAGVRSILITGCFQTGTAEMVPTLITFLDDLHPANRQLASDALYSLAEVNAELKAVVVDKVREALASSSWRVLEKAAILAAALPIEDTSNRMLALLSNEKAEVQAAAAYALKELENPETVSQAVAFIEQNFNRSFSLDEDDKFHDYQFVTQAIQHLCEFAGRQKYLPADSLFQQFIGKASEDGLIVHSPACRSSAIYALGKIHSGNAIEGIVSPLIGRLSDLGPPAPEYPDVREACAYTLGNMQAESALPALQKFAVWGEVSRGVGGASAWAVEKLTGEKRPLPEPFGVLVTADWFLSPVRNQSTY